MTQVGINQKMARLMIFYRRLKPNQDRLLCPLVHCIPGSGGEQDFDGDSIQCAAL